MRREELKSGCVEYMVKKIHFLRAFPDKGSFDDGLTVEKELSPLSLETQ